MQLISKFNLNQKYVQDKLKEMSKQIYKTLMEQDGHIYICGDVSMADDVNKTLKIIFQDNHVEDAEMAINSLKVSSLRNSLNIIQLQMYINFNFCLFSTRKATVTTKIFLAIPRKVSKWPIWAC